MKISRRELGIALSGLAGAVTLSTDAQATSAREWSLEALVASSDRCVIGQTLAHRSEWIVLGGSKRIVTYTRFLQELDVLDERAGEDELELLTLGGRVGSLLQKVPGSPALKDGERTLLFVGKESGVSRRVVGMAQGHFPITSNSDGDFLRASYQLPHLYPSRPRKDGTRPDAAIATLDQCALPEAMRLIKAAR